MVGGTVQVGFATIAFTALLKVGVGRLLRPTWMRIVQWR